ncbi:MAG: hypothetical protein ACYCZX_03110 [Rhodospirillaceae bacterium]
MRSISGRRGSGIYGLIGLIAAALFVAVVTLEDSIALAIGRVGILVVLGLAAIVVFGAAVSLFRVNTRPPVIRDAAASQGADHSPRQPV